MASAFLPNRSATRSTSSRAWGAARRYFLSNPPVVPASVPPAAPELVAVGPSAAPGRGGLLGTVDRDASFSRTPKQASNATTAKVRFIDGLVSTPDSFRSRQPLHPQRDIPS